MSLGDRKLTPMMQQYLAAKNEHPEAILMFRMGDFFEMFFDDAKVAARELDLVLTSRDKDRGEDAVPMAGVPHHAITSYVARLVGHGHTVAICDQIEDPRQAKGLVKRAITRVVTPGTLSDLEALDPVSPATVACVTAPSPQAAILSVAILDLLAGELSLTRCDLATLGDELKRMGVRELLVDETLRQRLTGRVDAELPLRVTPGHSTEDAEVRRTLQERFGTDLIHGLDDGGAPADRRAVGELIHFADHTQRRVLLHLMPPRAYRPSDAVTVDESTRNNLEILETQMEGRRTGSLVWHLDRCRTAMGSRLIAQWLSFPLRDPAAIGRRLDSVAALKERREVRVTVQKLLDSVRDMERLLGRLAVGRATPHDVGLVRNALVVVPELKRALASLPAPLALRWGQLDIAPDVRELLCAALVEDPPLNVNDGGVFRRGYRPDLDELIGLATEGHDFLVDLERRERARTGISNLKVRYNKVFGYYLEVTKANLDQVPKDFVRKQTLVGAERYITDELKIYEDKVTHADLARKQRELELWDELSQTLSRRAAALRAISRLLAETDATTSLAIVADEGRYARPELVAEPVLELVDSRHPVLERLLPGGERFVPNDVLLDADSRQLLVITGPNMAGKSTVMRQVALTVLLAHVGSFVPAKRAKVGLCDRIFTRVGAADNLGRGRSTFMVEMMETAAILKHATRSSLVLLDEIGRGTSTFDGVSIAWAVAEHLHDQIACRTMFATHYHELTDLALERPRIINVSVAVKEHGGGIVFLRRLVEGPANRSYGIQVARLAELPESVLKRAREILANLEAGELDDHGMPFFASSRGVPEPERPQLTLFGRPHAEPSTVESELAQLDPLNLTPLQALSELDRLKKLLDR
jgi:DNA mismatch repair protein MutS